MLIYMEIVFRFDYCTFCHKNITLSINFKLLLLNANFLFCVYKGPYQLQKGYGAPLRNLASNFELYQKTKTQKRKKTKSLFKFFPAEQYLEM